MNEANVLRSLLPAVVNIAAHRAELDRRPETEAEAAAAAPRYRRVVISGSGFVVDHSGVIVTNWHVVQDAYEIYVTFGDGSRTPAKVLSAARPVDIALLKVDVGHPLPTAPFGDSDRLQVGDPVFAVGNPLGLGTSVSAGIVSALNRDVLNTPYDDFIQTDAAINHGNSGGPLLDSRGEVVGLDTALVSPISGSVGLGFAIPSNVVRFVVRRLLRYGWVRPGWIGAKLQEVGPDMAEAIGMPAAGGSIIAHLRADGPAAKAGLQVGDVILRFGDETPVDTRALMRDIVKTPGGERVGFTIWRDGHALAVPVTIAIWPKAEALARELPTPPTRPKPPPVPPDLGLTLARLTDRTRAKYNLPPNQTGVLVSGVLANTDAAERGMVAGDVILRVQDAVVATPEQVLRGFTAARRRKRAFAMVLLLPKAAKQPGPKWLALRVAERAPTVQEVNSQQPRHARPRNNPVMPGLDPGISAV